MNDAEINLFCCEMLIFSICEMLINEPEINLFRKEAHLCREFIRKYNKSS